MLHRALVRAKSLAAGESVGAAAARSSDFGVGKIIDSSCQICQIICILELTAYNTKWCLGALRFKESRTHTLWSRLQTWESNGREAASARPSLAPKPNKFTAIHLHCPPEHKRPFPSATGERKSLPTKRRCLHHSIFSSTTDKCRFWVHMNNSMIRASLE